MRGQVPAGAFPSSPPLVQVHDVLLLDLDGTVYRGEDAVPGATEAIAAAAAAGVQRVYLTNNASRSSDDVAAHLRRLGVAADAHDVITSAQAAAGMLVERLGAGARVLVIGGAGLVSALEQAGLVAVHSADDSPVALVQGFSPEVGWAMLAEGAYALQHGVPWIATNGDLTVPFPRGMAPENGALVEALRAATGARPEVAGKPHRALADEALRRSGGRRPLLVGDRLDTDIACASAAGVPSMLVLTGVCGAPDVLAAAPRQRPTYVAADLGGLLRHHQGTRADGRGGWRCGRHTARVVAGHLRLSAEQRLPTSDDGAPDDFLDALRAAGAACWAAADEGAEVDLDAAVTSVHAATG